MKYIKLEISKRTGFWRYKVKGELNLQSQSQASFIKGIIIRGMGYCGVTKTGVNEWKTLIVLEIVDSELYYCEDPTDNRYVSTYNLCLPLYLTESYQEKFEFYLGYDTNIIEVINAFKNLDNGIDKMVQAPGTPALNYSEIGTKYIKLKISKRAGFWRYRIEYELNLQPCSHAPYIKEIQISGMSDYKKVETKVNEWENYNLMSLEIADSDLYFFEDPMDNNFYSLICLCPSMYLLEPHQKTGRFYLKSSVDINEIIDVFKDLDNRIDKMVQASGTPAFNYSQTETKYIKLKIFKKAGFWRYKVEVELNLQPQSQASFIKEIIISEGILKESEITIMERQYAMVLEIAGSRLYDYENPNRISDTDVYSLCPLIYLTKPYQKSIEFYLKYDIDINEVINAFKNLDNKIGEMVQAPGTPAFNYFLNETKYIKLRISKKAGFWRYKIEVELNLQSQPQASLIKEIIIERYYETVKTEVKEGKSLIILRIEDSKLYHYEDPMDDRHNYIYSLCSLIYLTKPYQQNIVFCLKHDVNIDEIVNAFKDLDNRIDRMVQALGTPAFDCPLIEMKYIKLKVSKKAGFWRYKVEVELNLQPQSQALFIKQISIFGDDYFAEVKTKVIEKQDLISLEIARSRLYNCEDPLDNRYNVALDLCNSMYLTELYQQSVKFYLKYDVNINEVIDAFKELDNIINKHI